MVAAVITRDGSLGIRFEGGWGIGNPWIRLAQPGKRPIFLFRPPPSLFRALFSLELSSRTHVFLFSFVVWLSSTAAFQNLGEEALRRSEAYWDLGMGTSELRFFSPPIMLLSGVPILTTSPGLCAVPCTQSFGGYVSSKVIELNAGVHSLAIAIAVRFQYFSSYRFTPS